MSAPVTRRIRPRSGKPIWLFDLDNTLHHASHAIFPAINQAMTQYIAQALRIADAEADRLRNDYTCRYGATLLGLTRHHGIDPHHFLSVVHTFPELHTMLRAERGLARILSTLPGRKMVLTNAPEIYARAVLRELKIDHLFERVIAIEHMRNGQRWRAKPDPTMLRQMMRAARVNSTDAILVEDTRGHLRRYKRFGLRTVWITGHIPLSQPNTGRPHYVDHRIRSLKSLRSRTRSIRQK